MEIMQNISLRTKVANHLRDIIRLDHFDGTQIPNENQLAKKIGVSRGTISQALSILNEEGIIIRKQGSGTYANLHTLQLKIRADLPFRLTELIENSGYKASVSIIDHQIQYASEETAKILEIPKDSQILLLKRVYFANEDPAMYLIDRIPTSILCEPYEIDDLEQLLYQFLRKRCNIHVNYTLSKLVPTIAGEEVAELLKVRPESALLRCDDINFDKDNKPVVATNIFYKDELIRFSLIRKEYF